MKERKCYIYVSSVLPLCYSADGVKYLPDLFKNFFKNLCRCVCVRLYVGRYMSTGTQGDQRCQILWRWRYRRCEPPDTDAGNQTHPLV